jgi:hypothetical protein
MHANSFDIGNTAFYSLSIFICLVQFSELAALISLITINLLVFIKKTHFVYYDVRIKFLNTLAFGIFYYLRVLTISDLLLCCNRHLFLACHYFKLKNKSLTTVIFLSVDKTVAATYMQIKHIRCRYLCHIVEATLSRPFVKWDILAGNGRTWHEYILRHSNL